MKPEHEVLSGRGIGVAILDTGLYPHVDFGNRITVFRDYIQKKRFAYDDNGHGTHVAGILAGSGRASGGRFAGMAPGCHLIGMKVLDHRGGGKKTDAIDALSWICANHRLYQIRIINISVGTIEKESSKNHRELISAVERAWDEGLIVVAAAGNMGPSPGTITAPGSSKKVITVGSTDFLRGKVSTSGRGPTQECICKPDLVADGSQVVSCAARGGAMPYQKKSGTSMATPQVSGAIALLLEKYPQLTNLQVKLRLKESCRDLGYARNLQGWGMLDVERLLTGQQ